MKKLLAALLVLAMMLMGVAALAEGDGYELALVTDVGNIDDQSFNQSSYEGMVAYAEENGLTSHAGVIALNRGVPCVTGVAGIMDEVEDGMVITVDGIPGLVYAGRAY